MQKKYVWQRFWVRENADLVLESNAYLPDPEEDYGRLVNDDIATLGKVFQKGCVILLGEPGIGKSKSLQADFEALTQTKASNNDKATLIDLGAVANLTDVQNLLLCNGVVQSWIAGDGMLHLCLDSLDEALPTYPGLPKALIGMIKDFPKERLRLAIACRAGEFPAFLQNELEAHFGQEGVTRWHMAPLRQKDVHIAASKNGLDGSSFLNAVAKSDVEPLAARPITLDLLLGEAVSGSELLSDVWALYERGCRKLISEHPESSRGKERQRSSLEQSVAVAGRIGCVTIFGAYAGVDSNPDSATKSGTVAVKDLAGGQEIIADNPFPVGESSIRDVLKTGLFTATGPTFKWAHKSYSEFLAAHHIHENAIAKNQLVILLGCGGRVAPALRGVTAWLTSKDDQVFREVLRTDPEVLFFADLSTATDQQRSELVSWLLQQAEANNPLVQEWGMFWTYRKLKHSDLQQQLEPIIKGPAAPTARHCAIQIADACQEVGLQRVLADLALNGAEPSHLRIAAASFVADNGEPDQRARLLPLALKADQDEEEGRLRAHALSAVWPEFCTWPEIRDRLGTESPSTTSAVGRFLAFDLVDRLPESALLNALVWSAQKDSSLDGLSAWASATDRLLTKAIHRAEDPALRRGTVDALFARISKHYKMFSDSAPTEPGPQADSAAKDARRAIAAELISRLAPNGHLVIPALRPPNPLLTRTDVEFAMERWAIAEAREKAVWETVILSLVDWQNPTDYSPVLEHAYGYPGLRLILDGHQQAFRCRVEQARRDEAEADAHREQVKEQRIGLIRDLLTRSETESKYFGDLLYTMSFPVDRDFGSGLLGRRLHDLPGWHVLMTLEQQRLLLAGRAFVMAGRPFTFRALRHGGPTRNSAAGYQILRELFYQEAIYLEKLSPAVWKRWAPAVVLCQCGLSEKEYDEADHALIKLAVSRAEAQITRTVEILLRRGQVFGMERQLLRVANVTRSAEFEAAILNALLRPGVPLDMYLGGMRMLIERSNAAAIEIVAKATSKVPVALADDLPRLALDSALWAEHAHEAAWPHTWNAMLGRPEFVAIFLDAPGWLARGAKSFGEMLDWLSDEQLNAFYVWLRREFGTPPGIPVFAEEPKWVSQNTIIANLQRRRSASSVAVLERIERQYPDDWYLRKATWEAKRLLLEASWEPLPPSAVKRLVTDKRQLLVRDEQELMEAVWAALEDYQADIRTEGSRVMRLWNEPVHTPKPEEPLSREIGAEIQRVLASRGVTVTHEVKIRDGQFVDIYVAAVTSNSQQRLISLIIEVKGCWHKELKTALETQLSMRYLKDNESHFGIYLVVWFQCDKWNNKDRRKASTSRQTRSDLAAFLARQATEVNGTTASTIRALVLDASLEGPAPKPKRRKRAAKKTA